MSSSKPKCIFDVGGPIHSSAVFRIRDDGSLYLLEKTHVTGILGYWLLKSLVIRSENNLPIDANRIGSIGSSIGYD